MKYLMMFTACFCVLAIGCGKSGEKPPVVQEGMDPYGGAEQMMGMGSSMDGGPSEAGGGNTPGQSGAPSGRGGGMGAFDPESIFKQRDTNNDGKITADELTEEAKRWGDPMQYDTDKDGGVSMEEWKKGMDEAMSRFRGSRGEGGMRGGFGGSRPEKVERPEMDDDE